MVTIAIDPGAHIGVALRKEDGSIFTLMVHKQPEYVWDLMIGFHPDVVVIERFVTSNRISEFGIETVELAGSMKAMAHVLKAKVVLHIAGTRIPFLKDAKQYMKDHPEISLTLAEDIKAAGGHGPSHEIDALAHLFAFEHGSERAETIRRLYNRGR